MILLILLLPILGFFSGSLFGRYIGSGVSVLSTVFVFISFIFSLFIFYDIIITGSVYTFVFNKWIFVDTLEVNWSFCFDSLTSLMSVVVTFISALVHLYSTEYMKTDPHLSRFMSYLSLFTFFMLILITANNFLQMFVGWEGVGVCSYLLINFWFTRIQANKAAIKAMLVNRIGDFFLLLALFTIYFTFNSLDYDIVFSLVPLIRDYKIIIGIISIPLIDLICLLLFLGAMGKSAQLGLHIWLPDAMEGPTPVSALIHAATMVTAGVFLISRCSYIFEFSYFTLNVIILIGSVTAFFAATTGLFQNDMKKVIAYSTCSQLGYMIFACGLSGYEVGLFHLTNHAFFKALLFLGAGSIIHAFSDEQDMRKMGGVSLLLPFSYSIMLVGSLALMGFPFLAGFYSKDVILEICFAKYNVYGHFSFALGVLAAFCTAFYSIRLLFLAFLAKPNGNKKIILNVHEGTWPLTLPLFILSLLSIFVGFLTKDLLLGLGTHFWGASIFIFPQNYFLTDVEFLAISYKLLPLLITFLGAFCSYTLYVFQMSNYYKIKNDVLFNTLYTFFNKKWYFDRTYNEFVTQNIINACYNYFYKTIDRGLLEKFGPYVIVDVIKKFSLVIKQYQTGLIFQYLYSFLCIVLICFVFYLFMPFKYALLTFFNFFV